MKQLLIASHNKGKIAEFADMLQGLDIELKSAADFNLPEPEETGNTFIENAVLKARAAMEATGLPSLADDSGLAIDALNGEPGIHSARWGQTPEGRDFNMAMHKVHEKLGGIDGSQSAHFVAVLALLYPDGREEIFEGRANGHLCWPMRGEKGHGYDPIFIPEGESRTFAEMGADEKNAMSHRAKAVAKFKTYLEKNA
jgi:XTP/dITP diphosphohydrolase